MMLYLSSFSFPSAEEENSFFLDERRTCYDTFYPFQILPQCGLCRLDFEPITILYGGNGTGKTTILNIIAQKLQLHRDALYNRSNFFETYTNLCHYEQKAPNSPDSCIITSDDVFDYMLTVRTNNDEIGECREEARDQWGTLRYGNTVKFRGMEDYDTVRIQLLARSRSVSRKQFIRRVAGEEVKLNSNGETALRYFDERLKSDRLYCLDEPENSLSPKRQQELAAMLEQLARYCGCQFIIATHSPFLLAMNNARIYNLDAAPAQVQSWWELDNTKLYYRFFKQHRELFE